MGMGTVNKKEVQKRLKQISKENAVQIRKFEKAKRRKVIPKEEYMTTIQKSENVIEFDNLKTHFFTDVGVVRAVDGISFDIPMGKTVAVVGESGCGKSVTSLSLMRLVQGPSGQIVDGQIRYNRAETGECIDLAHAPISLMRELRGNEIAMIFQEPMNSLNPIFTIGNQVDEAIKIHNPKMKKEEIAKRTVEMLTMVGIARPEGIYKAYPHELSGGMRQRVMIAMALSCNPKLIVADEPTTALDVTIQAQILDILRDVKEKINTSIMLITHDLGVVAEMADYIVVMYAGKIVEKGTVHEIFAKPSHPYTIGLLKSKSVLYKKVDRLYSIAGQVPNPVNMPNYCYFKDRCDQATSACNAEQPTLRHLSDTHEVACYLC